MKQSIISLLAKIIQCNLEEVNCPYITRSWCIQLAYIIVNTLEEQGVNLDG